MAATVALVVSACGGADNSEGSVNSSVLRVVFGTAVLDVPPESPQGVVASLGLEGETELFSTADGLYVNGPDGAMLVDPIDRTIEVVAGIDVVLAASDEGIVGTAGDDLVAIASSGGTPVTLEVPDGRSATRQKVAMYGSHVVVADGGWFAEYDVNSGEALWVADSGELPWDLDDPTDAPFDAPRELVVGAGTVGAHWLLDDVTVLVALASDDGRLLGLNTIPRPENVTHELEGSLDGGRLIVRVGDDFRNTPSRGWIRSIDIPTGTELWSVESNEWFDRPLVTADLIAAPNQDSSLWLIEPQTGDALAVPIGARVQRAPLRHERGLVMSTVDGEVLLVDETTGQQVGEVVVLPDVDEVTGIALVGDIFYVATVQSFINNDNDPAKLWGIDVNSF